ncbi:expressed conserved protein [Echinococcus multilocularis]|uniref:Expressed conserved protein n=1 Tax=Echinococcus multilocularis TaxID=6211 RepID=A0A068Y141_ECHMU|nr:expressed conserved protein [Echinococcus multilocularis]
MGLRVEFLTRAFCRNMIMPGKEPSSDETDAFTKALRLIVLASGDYFILTGTVSDVVVEALQQHCEYLAGAFRSLLGNSVSPLTLPRLIASLSDCKLHLSRILTYLSTYALASNDPENPDSLAVFDPSSKSLSVFHAECEKLNIHLENPATFAPLCLLVTGQHIRMQRIDGFATNLATTEQYLEFTRLRQRARLLGQPFDIWLARAGLPIQRGAGGSEVVPILAYLVTLCLRDVIDLALANRQKFGIDLCSQMTAVELQQASLSIRRMKGYL